jgi:hypothetical protein
VEQAADLTCAPAEKVLTGVVTVGDRRGVIGAAGVEVDGGDEPGNCVEFLGLGGVQFTRRQQ